MKNFLGIPEEWSEWKISPVVVLPVPLEMTTSYEKGTRNGPEKIIQASHQVEFFDAELGMEACRKGIFTEAALDFEGETAESAQKKIEKAVARLLDAGKFPILLGGEHALSGAAIKAASERHPNLSVLQIDAHADLRESYEGSRYSHASAMRLAHPYVRGIVGVGIRSVCAEEVAYAKEHPDIFLQYDPVRRRNKNWIDEAIGRLTDTVYLTVDLDGFDPSLIPATGTPEPGGLGWYEGLDLIRTLFERKKVITADVVELLPLPHQHASEFAAAKLVYKIIGYWQKFQNSL